MHKQSLTLIINLKSQKWDRNEVQDHMYFAFTDAALYTVYAKSLQALGKGWALTGQALAIRLANAPTPNHEAASVLLRILNLESY